MPATALLMIPVALPAGATRRAAAAQVAQVAQVAQAKTEQAVRSREAERYAFLASGFKAD